MIVVDANIIAYLTIESELSREARMVAEIDPDWRVPPLWRYELTSAVTTMIRAGAMNLVQGKLALEQAGKLFSDSERSIDQTAVLDTAMQYGISAYDAQYVALAQREGVQCLTNDGPLAKKTPGVTVLLRQYVTR